MAETEKFQGIVQIGGDASGATAAMNQAGVGSIALGNIIAQVAVKAFEMAAEAVKQLGVQLVNSAMEASQAQQAQVALATAMKTSGTYTEANFKATQKYAQEVQDLTLFTDDAANAAMKSLSAFGLQGESLRKATLAAADLAQGTGMDLPQAAAQLAKAIGTSTDALSRQGIKLDENATKEEKAAEAVQKIAALYGGQSTAAANTFQGKLTSISKAFEDMQKVVGEAIIGNKGLQIVFNEVIAALKNATTWLGNHQKQISQLVSGALIGLLTTLQYLIVLIDMGSQAWNGIGNFMLWIFKIAIDLGKAMLDMAIMSAEGWYMILDLVSKVIPGLGGIKDGLKAGIDTAKEMSKTMGEMSAASAEEMAAGTAAADKRTEKLSVLVGAIEDVKNKVKATGAAFEATADAVAAATASITTNVINEAEVANKALLELVVGYTNDELAAFEKRKENVVKLYQDGVISAQEYYTWLGKEGGKYNDDELARYNSRLAFQKTYWSTLNKVSSTAADEMLSNQKNAGTAMEDAAKKTMRTLIDAEIDKAATSISIAAATEIGKAQLGSFLSFGASLLAIPVIVAAATAAKSIIYGLIGGFAEGGMVGSGGSRIPLGGGGMVATGAPALVMAHEGEMIGTPSALAASGIGAVSVVFNNYGAINSRTDIEEIGEIIGAKVRATLQGTI